MGLEWGFYIGKGIARSGLNCFDNPLLWAQKDYLGHFSITLSIKCLCDISERKNDRRRQIGDKTK